MPSSSVDRLRTASAIRCCWVPACWPTSLRTVSSSEAACCLVSAATFPTSVLAVSATSLPEATAVSATWLASPLAVPATSLTVALASPLLLGDPDDDPEDADSVATVPTYPVSAYGLPVVSPT